MSRKSSDELNFTVDFTPIEEAMHEREVVKDQLQKLFGVFKAPAKGKATQHQPRQQYQSSIMSIDGGGAIGQMLRRTVGKSTTIRQLLGTAASSTPQPSIITKRHVFGSMYGADLNKLE